MPISLDDQARLPPMVLPEKVLERQRQEDLRQFRQYLVDSGSIRSLVKMYKHVAKKELRMDNPTLLKEFLAQYRDETPEQQETERLAQENAALGQQTNALELQIEMLKSQIDECHRQRAARALWKSLTSKEFWEGVASAHAPDLDSLGTSLTLAQLFFRLCGQKVDHATGKVIVNLVRPPFLEDSVLASAVISHEAFMKWIVHEVAEEAYLLIADDEALSRPRAEDALRRGVDVPESSQRSPSLAENMRRFADLPKDPPFEAGITQAIRESGLYPEHLDEVREVVELDRSLAVFLELAAERFSSAVAEEPADA